MSSRDEWRQWAMSLDDGDVELHSTYEDVRLQNEIAGSIGIDRFCVKQLTAQVDLLKKQNRVMRKALRKVSNLPGWTSISSNPDHWAETVVANALAKCRALAKKGKRK